MMEQDFIFNEKSVLTNHFSINIKTPSNIALVKYWGKLDNQIPINSSISFTLDKCFTKSKIEFIKSNSHSLELYFENKRNTTFEKKANNFIKKIIKYCSYLTSYSIKIYTENSFPHSSGIASSASGMSALAVGIMSLENEISNIEEEYFINKSSFLARLGSGSACRSIKGNIMIWGETNLIENSSNLFAINPSFKIHSNFKNYKDTILIIDKDEKSISSTVGHSLMNNHPFIKDRITQANKNLKDIIEVLKNGNLEEFGGIVENEALTLHSMMMTSDPAFILMKPNTLKAIDLIWNFRKNTSIPLYFTLDAGANLHLLYPDKFSSKVLNFIDLHLKNICINGKYICDNLGYGFKIIKE